MSVPVSAARIHHQRHRRGLGVTELAERMGVPQSTLSDALRRGRMAEATLHKLVDALHEIPVLEGVDELLAVEGDELRAR